MASSLTFRSAPWSPQSTYLSALQVHLDAALPRKQLPLVLAAWTNLFREAHDEINTAVQQLKESTLFGALPLSSLVTALVSQFEGSDFKELVQARDGIKTLVDGRGTPTEQTRALTAFAVAADSSALEGGFLAARSTPELILPRAAAPSSSAPQKKKKENGGGVGTALVIGGVTAGVTAVVTAIAVAKS